MIKLTELVNTSVYKLFVDLDGVLVDFDKGYLQLTGHFPTSYEKIHGKEKFWGPIEKMGAPFWFNLPWTKDGKDLWKYVKKYNPTILSAPSQDPQSTLGKKIWLKKHLPNAKYILVPAKDKQLYAKPNHILIDDWDRNINQWKDSGGIPILHKSTTDTIKQLKKLGL